MKWHKTNQMAKWPNGFHRNCENVRSRAVCSSCKIWLQINAKWGRCSMAMHFAYLHNKWSWKWPWHLRASCHRSVPTLNGNVNIWAAIEMRLPGSQSLSHFSF